MGSGVQGEWGERVMGIDGGEWGERVMGIHGGEWRERVMGIDGEWGERGLEIYMGSGKQGEHVDTYIEGLCTHTPLNVTMVLLVNSRARPDNRARGQRCRQLIYGQI